MKLTMRLTLDGLVRALRTQGEAAADDRVEEARRDRAKPETEDRDERRA